MKRRGRRGLASVACCTMLVLAPMPSAVRAQSPSATEPKKNQVEEIRSEASRSFWRGDFESLARLHDAHSPPGRLLPNGRSPLASFESGLHTVLDHAPAQRLPYLLALEAQTLAWTKAYPKSSLAHSLYALALLETAWYHRGTGFARTVLPQAWKAFDERVAMAQSHLLAHREAAMSQSEGFVTMLALGRVSRWTPDQLIAFARAGSAINPTDDRIHQRVVAALVPKWAGDAVSLDRYINEVAERTRAARGETMYALMYSWAADEEFEGGLFEQSAARWPRMRQGFRDLLLRHENPFQRNRFAYFACVAQDIDTVRELLPGLADSFDPQAWGDGKTATYETCKAWAARQ
jgi:hypothetical protein